MANSESSTPSRFAAQASAAEDVLKEQVSGLVQLSDYRKRRAEIESGASSGASTPLGGEAKPASFKKRKKVGVKKGALSFGDDEEIDETGATPEVKHESSEATNDSRAETPTTGDEGTGTEFKRKKKLKANSAIDFRPKAMTKSALIRDTQLKESLRKEYIQIREAVKATEIAIPFVFFDGSHVPGGVCRIRKGEQIWLFLDKARKVGASQRGERGERKDWARIGVDDLMFVRGDLILPHHYEFFTFIADKTVGYGGAVLFPFSAEPTKASPKNLIPASRGGTRPEDSGEESEADAMKGNPILQTAADRRQEAAKPPEVPTSELEGYSQDPTFTKIVDRRWYEKNKHIYPTSTWEDFDPEKEYTTGARKDGMGNSFFFSR
ncbi:hypothetical protein K431DRAFT_272813 [Polychaeton citri CBS 116435]|uniref:FAM50A/XAP5 C-terminal domain-containing protein n=1 Tax=Polychaeton citri CBS 116435 TaxID=1314669 RepID=A0A9P4Q4C4_9PEZI|nr:hypothetical protein K431DRAFT_272813 [Polychaeton citri CBS 116435]